MVESRQKQFKEILKLVKRYIQAEKESGIREYSFSKEEWKPLFQNRKAEGKSSRLKTVYGRLKRCRRCPLHRTRTNVVFGEGNENAELVFVGEAPGQEEDSKGRPFVGQAGQLLTRIIEAISLKREDVYICNLLRCRPPNNRNPLPSEIEACKPYLEEQLAIIRPKLICTLGKFAAQALLDSKESITKLRGRFYDYRGTKVMVTLHPGYLLRNPQAKKLVWEDMKKVKRLLGVK